VLIGIARTKIVAVLLGPAGVGLVGVYTAIVSAFSLAFGLGLDGSGTRRIAAVRADSGEPAASKLEADILRAAVGLGSLGGVVLVIAWSFELLERVGAGHGPLEVLLGVAVLVTIVGAAGLGILTGRRDLPSIARVHVIGGLLATASGVACIVLWGEAGVVPLVVLVALGPAAVSLWHLRGHAASLGDRLDRDSRRELLGLAKLGSALTVAGVASALSQVWARAIVLDEMSIIAVGLFQAAWALSMTYVGVAMAGLTTDFYPRLSAGGSNAESRQRIVGRQLCDGLILTGPLLILIAAFAPLILSILYTSEFAAAAQLLRWHALGDAIRIVTWPLGLTFLAAGRGVEYLSTEIAWHVVYLSGLALLVPAFGIDGAGYAYLSANAVFLALQCVLLARVENLRISGEPLRRLAALVGCIGVVIVATALLPSFLAQVTGVLLAAAVAVPAAKLLARR
jgi:PST family polysaccharide transporter